jgi:hypothetical protein
MRAFLAIPAFLILAACSEQQMCISRATHDLRFVEEAEGNLARGYALVETEVIEFEYERCGTNKDGSPRYCHVPDTQTVLKHKAIDLDAEAAKLASLRNKQKTLAAQADLGVLACQKAYPEG